MGERGLVALRLAASDPRVRRVVLLSTPGRPLVDVVADDFRNTHGEASAAGLRATVDELLRTGSLPAPDRLPPEHRDFFPPAEVGYLQTIFSLDPAAEARGVDVPVLVVRGGRSTGISEADTSRLAEALGPRAEVLVDPDAGYTLALQPAPPPGPTESSGDGDHGQFHRGLAGLQRDEELLARIAAWLGDGLGARTAGMR